MTARAQMCPCRLRQDYRAAGDRDGRSGRGQHIQRGQGGRGSGERHQRGYRRSVGRIWQGRLTRD
eukprot:1612070-Prymnesium_polylepis.2